MQKYIMYVNISIYSLTIFIRLISETPGNIDREVFGTELAARFAISEESQAEISKAATTATGGGRLDRLYEVYNGLVMSTAWIPLGDLDVPVPAVYATPVCVFIAILCECP